MTYADHGFQSPSEMIAAQRPGITEPVMTSGRAPRNRTIAPDKTPLPAPAAPRSQPAASVRPAATAGRPKRGQPSPKAQEANRSQEVYDKLYGTPKEPVQSAEESALYAKFYGKPDQPSLGSEEDKNNYSTVYPSPPNS